MTMNINIYYSVLRKPFSGPFNHETTLLFWEMVWQSDCSKIVMLTNTREQHRVSTLLLLLSLCTLKA